MSRESVLAQLEAMNMDRRTAQQMLQVLDENLRLSNRVAEQEKARLAEIAHRHALAQAKVREKREAEEGSGMRYRIEPKRTADGQPILDRDGNQVLTRVPWGRRSQMTPAEKSDAMRKLGEEGYLNLPWVIAFWVLVL